MVDSKTSSSLQELLQEQTTNCGTNAADVAGCQSTEYIDAFATTMISHRIFTSIQSVATPATIWP